MTITHFVRQSHRRLGMVFTATVLANFVSRELAPGEPAAWITYAPLPPLLLMFLSGLYLFVLPYRAGTRRRAGL